MKIEHKKALEKFYKFHGVGKLVNQRFKFWESQNPDGWSISFNGMTKEPTKKQYVAVFEESWLVGEFPQDFHYC